MPRLSTIVAALLAILAIPSVPWLFLALPPVTADLTWGNWANHVVAVIGFSIAASLTYRRARYSLIATLAICGYVVFLNLPMFFHVLTEIGFLAYADLIWTTAADTSPHRGFYLIWNLIALPVVAAVLIPLAFVTWWRLRGVQHEI